MPPRPTLAFAISLTISLTTGLASELSFNRDIRPILSDKCFACHGFDPKDRGADRRLDTAEGAIADVDGICAIVPGNPAKSDAWIRIISDDKDDVMPPPKAHKTLTADEKEKIKLWIEQGAKYQRHWAFEAPQRAPLPEVQDADWSSNPIDRFVLARLEKAALKPAPPADRRVLARRVALDITGLPPTLEEVEAFVQDNSPDAYEKLVERLMETPQWGEHRARYWLDAARYADTHGLHIDNYREIWPYRDWVINAFNRNLPFDQFTVEQIAGDLLPSPTREQLVATGFHRCNATTNEGGTIDEELVANYAHDRVTTTSWVWLGLTANCASCHDHKFDPITTKDFYAMAAFFRNTTQGPKDGNRKDTAPIVYLPEGKDDQRYTALITEIPDTRKAIGDRRTAAVADLDPWLANAATEDLQVRSGALVLDLPLNDGVGTEATGHAGGAPTTVKASGAVEWRDGGKLGKAAALTNNAHLDAGYVADFDATKPFSAGCWVNIPADVKEGSIIARIDDRKGLQGWELYMQGGRFGIQIASAEPAEQIRTTTRNPALKAGTWQHIFATYDGSGRAEGFALYVDGRPQQVSPQGKDLKGPSSAAVPLRIGRREANFPIGKAQIQGVRIYSAALSSGEARSLPIEQDVRSAFATAPVQRTPAQKDMLLSFFVDTVDRPSIQLVSRLASLEAEQKAIRERSIVSHIQEEKPGEPMANVLMRGAYDKPGEQVAAAGFSALHPIPADAPKNRLGLARWLVAPENPLTARVTVNRFWQELFGTGLVKTAEDFGSQGEMPSHPELLDWLSVEFRDSGWNVKHLFKLMLTSATYQQVALTTPEKLQKDPQNRLLSRGPRFRMDAEMIRDYALRTSSLLVGKIGGPSVRPYQPPGVWEAVAMPNSDTAKYQSQTGEALYRRSLYTFWKRTAPPATLDILNAPSRETCVVRRERTNTPLQALATLNDPQFIEAARQLAQHALKESGGTTNSAIDRLAQRVLLRTLTPAERAIVVQTQADLESQFASDPQGTTAFLAIGESKPDTAFPGAQLASLSLVANQLLNLDEALNK